MKRKRTTDKKNMIIALLVAGWIITFGVYGLFEQAWKMEQKDSLEIIQVQQKQLEIRNEQIREQKIEIEALHKRMKESITQQNYQEKQMNELRDRIAILQAELRRLRREGTSP